VKHACVYLCHRVHFLHLIPSHHIFPSHPPSRCAVPSNSFCHVVSARGHVPTCSCMSPFAQSDQRSPIHSSIITVIHKVATRSEGTFSHTIIQDRITSHSMCHVAEFRHRNNFHSVCNGIRPHIKLKKSDFRSGGLYAHADYKHARMHT
jgi:hypothetical protein